MRGILHGTLTENSRVDNTWNRRVMDPIPLNAVRAAAADVGADTAGTAIAVHVADIVGAAADIAADARAALAGAAADTAVVAADVRAAIADAAADVAAAADLAGELYRRATRKCELQTW